MLQTSLFALFSRTKIPIILLLLLPLCAFAQRHTINGYISDAQSGERLIGASVYDTISHKGTVTNNSGFYTLTLNEPKAAIQVSYVGYQASDIRQVSLSQDTLLNIRLSGNTSLDEVVVTSRRSVSSPESVQMSAIEIPVAQLKNIPAIGGEVDIMKAIQLLPGVQSGSEGSAGVYVRGGGPDENLILLDGVTLYSVNHIMGFFSVFNADAVKNVTLYKGNFPAQYGGRLSGIIDVRQNDGNTENYHGNISVGLLAAHANFEGPIPHKHDSTGTTTFNISARRTYFDLFTTPIMMAITSKNGYSSSAGAYFYDVNAKLTHTFENQNDKLSGSFYMGDDGVYINNDYRESRPRPYSEHMQVRMNWGNILAAVNWEHRYNARLFSNTQLSYTRYRYRLRENLATEEQMDSVNYRFDQQMGYNSSLRDLTLQSHYDWTPLPNNSLHFGFQYTYHQFLPEVSRAFSTESGSTTPNHTDTTFTDGTLHGHEVALYLEDQWSPWRWLKVNIGLRGSLYAIDGKVYPSFEPRVGLRALIIKDLAFKASYSYTTQYVHMLSNSSVALPTDLWVPVTRNILPMHSMIVAAGLSYNILDQAEVSMEGYYKRSVNLLEYRDGASFFGANTSWQDKVAMGDGWSYGVELLLQRKVGPVTGWIGYTWSRTMRQFDREGQVINGGKPFHAKYDREHDLSVTLQYQITPRIDIAGTFIYGTGTRGSLTMYSYYDPADNINITQQQERNNFKMPDYHRLDFGVNFHFPHAYRWCADAEHILSLSVYNVYCHDNPYMMISEGPYIKQISIFPVLPSISYTFKF